MKYLNEYKINTIYWVPSALCIVANLGALENADLPKLKKVLFAGEVMPMKQLNIWRKKFNNVMFANLYGPTETTDICTYYVVDREFNNGDTLPIGKHCNNCDILIIKEDGTLDTTTNVKRITATCLKYGFVPNNQMQTVKGFTLLPSDFLCPKDYKTKKIHLTENSLVIHHFDGSWIPKKEKFKRICQKILGRKITQLIVKIKNNGN